MHALRGSPSRLAAAVLAAVAAAQTLAPNGRVVLYATALAVPALLWIAFDAYLALAERGMRPWSWDLAAAAGATALLMLDLPGRFAGQLAGGPPGRPGGLVLAALAVAALPSATRLARGLADVPLGAPRRSMPLR